jgi:dTMP kinase
MEQAKLICLEALDSGGKSTQVQLFKNYFEQHNLKYEYVHFPLYEQNAAGTVIASYLRGEYGNIDEIDPIFVANIYAMNRFLYLPYLRKQLLENDVVLLDRYVFSNMAYQGAKYNAETLAKIMRDWINEFEFGFLELPYPDLSIFFNVPLEIIQERLENKREGSDREYLNGKEDIHEKNIKFQEKVRDNYIELLGYQNYNIIHTGSKTPEEIFKICERYLDYVLYNKPLILSENIL